MSKKGLGRGIEHLIQQNFSEEENSSEIQNISIKEVKVNPYQPRKYFDDDKLEELALSIKENGIFQPILVRKAIIGHEIISGERRFRAAKKAGLKEIPVIVYDYNDEQMMKVALVENIQREDLTIVEEAKSYKIIIDNLKLTQEELGKMVGKSRSHIANILRILKLDDAILDKLDEKLITLGHVKVLVNIEDKKKLNKIIDLIISENLTVRQVEELAKDTKKEKVKTKPKTSTIIGSRNKRLEKIIREKLNVKVSITGDSKGRIEIKYSSESDLERILEDLNLI